MRINYIDTMEVNGEDIIVTDPCYVVTDKDNYDSDRLDNFFESKHNFRGVGLTDMIIESTIYGDWSEAMFKTKMTPAEGLELYAKINDCDYIDNLFVELENKGVDVDNEDFSIYRYILSDQMQPTEKICEKIGEFCADAGMVAVFKLDEILKYNPDFDYHINRPWTTTVIKDFVGKISCVHYYPTEDGEPRVAIAGEGNYNFFSCCESY